MSYTEMYFALQFWAAMLGIGWFALLLAMFIAIQLLDRR